MFNDEDYIVLGYTICPLCFPSYVYCDKECSSCDVYNDFVESFGR